MTVIYILNAQFNHLMKGKS